MWPFKQDKGVTISPGESAMFNINAMWSTDKSEVAIMTDKGPIVINEKSKCFLEITSKNTNPIKIQIIPDFNSRELNFIEVLDPNAKVDKNKPTIIFSGIEYRQNHNTTENQIEYYNKYIEENDKKLIRYKRNRDIITIISVTAVFLNIYIFIISNKIVNLLLSIVVIYTIYRLWSSYKKVCVNYLELRKSIKDIIDNRK